jgi:hypothetical protein
MEKRKIFCPMPGIELHFLRTSSPQYSRKLKEIFGFYGVVAAGGC